MSNTITVLQYGSGTSGSESYAAAASRGLPPADSVIDLVRTADLRAKAAKIANDHLSRRLEDLKRTQEQVRLIEQQVWSSDAAVISVPLGNQPIRTFPRSFSAPASDRRRSPVRRPSPSRSPSPPRHFETWYAGLPRLERSRIEKEYKKLLETEALVEAEARKRETEDQSKNLSRRPDGSFVDPSLRNPFTRRPKRAPRIPNLPRPHQYSTCKPSPTKLNLKYKLPPKDFNIQEASIFYKKKNWKKVKTSEKDLRLKRD